MAVKQHTVSQVEGEHIEYSGQTLWNKFVTSATKYPNNLALVSTHQPSGFLGYPNTHLEDTSYTKSPYLRLTYEHFADAVNKFANALLARGVGPGTPVVSFLPNVAELGIAMWATWKLGGTWVPINPKHMQNKPEVTHMIKTALSTRESKKGMFIVYDAALAEGADLLDIEIDWLKILVSDEKREGWENFQDVFTSAPETHPENPSFETQVGHEPLSVLFTSGTTSMPKGLVRHLDWHAFSLEQRLHGNSHSHGDKIFLVAPNNHAFANTWYILAHATGGTVVHPGPTFSAPSLMETLLAESCTRISLVPTMVYALLDVKNRWGAKNISVDTIGLSGAMVTPEIVNKCITELGAGKIENQWGMTEGCVTATHDIPIEHLFEGDYVSVGYVPPAAKARVCAPGTTEPLPLNIPGEFHFSTQSMGKEYIGRESSDFYSDPDGTKWFITGDQASIDEQGRIFLTGRYKEMIIRGGENIAPAAIENVLATDPDLLLLNVQIVGAKDDVAGEVPVAIYLGKTDPTIARKVQQMVLNEISSAHVPDQVVSTEELGIEDYPRTMSGKIKKNELQVLVQEFRDKEEQEALGGMSSDSQNSELAQVIKKIWKRALGYEVDEYLSFASFADSITIMRTRDMIAKATGKQVSIDDMNEAENIAGQIKMLQSQTAGAQPKKPKRAPREGPVTAKDCLLFQHRPETFTKGKELIESTLAKYNRKWDDIADVAPSYDFCTVMNQNGVMDTWNVTFGFTTKVQTKEEARTAIRKTLANIPIFSSFYLWDKEVFKTDSAVHIIMKQTDEYLNSLIHDFGTVQTVDDVKAMADKYPVENAAKLPGPCCSAGYAYVEETKTVAVFVMLNHAIMDASCVLILQDDLEATLGGQPLPEHIDYKIWLDSHYTLKDSLEAQLATEWYVNRLKGISTHRDAFFLDLKGPRRSDGDHGHQFDVPDLLKLRAKYPELTAPVIVKAAFALLCAHESKHSHALFSNYQASRERFPFVPKSLDDLGYDFGAANVAGQTIELATNLVEVKKDEPVVEYFKRMQVDQDNQTKYAAAPMRSVINGLGKEDGPMIIETLRNVAFNWVPGFGSGSMNAYDNLDTVAMAMHLDDGFGMTAGLGGDAGYTVFIEFYGTILSIAEQKELAKLMEGITSWLVEEDNWEKTVGGYVDNLKDVELEDITGENELQKQPSNAVQEVNGYHDVESVDGIEATNSSTSINGINGVNPGVALMA